MGSHFILQGIFLTQGSNLISCIARQILYHWANWEALFCMWKVKVKVAQSGRMLCNPTDDIVYGILQARILEWIDFPFSRGSSQPWDWTQVSCIAGGFFTSWGTREASIGMLLFSHYVVSDSLWPYGLHAAYHAALSFTISWSLLKPMSIESVMLYNHLILCYPLLLSSIFPSIRIFSNESALCIRWPNYWSFSNSPSNEYSGFISFRVD